MERAVRYLVLFAAMLVALFVLVIQAVATADTVNIAGDWNLTIETPNGTGTPTVTFKQDGETLTGTYKGRFGETALKGTIKGNEFKFSFTISPQGQDLVVEYSGTVDGDSMKGKAKFGDMGEGAFTGKRKPAETPAPK